MSKYKELYSNRIRDLILVKRMTQKEVASLIPLSERQLGQNLKNGDMKISTLKRIAEILHVPITYFFEESNPNIDVVNEPNNFCESVSNNINNPKTLKNMNRLIESQEKTIKSQEKTIALQESRIDFLEDKLSTYESKDTFSKDCG